MVLTKMKETAETYLG